MARRKQKLLMPIAEKARKEGNSRGGKSSAKLPTTSKIDTRKEAAKEAGVGERTYDAGKAILAEKAEEERLEKRNRSRLPNLANEETPSNTRDELAKKAGVSGDTLHKVEKITKEADELRRFRHHQNGLVGTI